MTRCDKCGDTHFIRFSSLQKKRCAACGAEYPWRLKPGQRPIVTSSRDKRKTTHD